MTLFLKSQPLPLNVESVAMINLVNVLIGPRIDRARQGGQLEGACRNADPQQATALNKLAAIQNEFHASRKFGTGDLPRASPLQQADRKN